MATWTERLKGWFEWLFIRYKAADAWLAMHEPIFSRFATKEQYDRIWDGLPDELQADPKLKAEFDRVKGAAKAENVLKAETEKFVNDLATPIIEQIVGPIMNVKKCEPDAALEIAIGIIKAQLAIDVTIGAAQFVSETMSAGQLETLTDWYKTLVRKTGIMGPVTMLYKAPVEMGVIRPLSYKLHETFRNVIPDVSWAATSFMKGDLGSADFDNVIKWSGLYPFYETALKHGMYREPRHFELSMMCTDKLEDRAWLEDKLKRAEYDAEDQVIMASGLIAKYLNTWWTKVANRYAYSFKEGFMSETDLRARISTLGLPKPVQEYIVEDAKQWYDIDYKLDILSSYDDAFKKDLITESDYRKLLAEIPLMPERLEERVYRMTMKKTPKPKAVVVKHRQGVKVSSKPSNAYIYLDSEELLLLTPQTLDTEAGTHTLDLYLPGYAVWSTEFSVAADQFIEVHTELEKIEEVI